MRLKCDCFCLSIFGDFMTPVSRLPLKAQISFVRVRRWKWNIVVAALEKFVLGLI